MLSAPSAIAFGLFGFLATLVGTRLAIGFLSARNIVDAPGARTSHQTITPRGGGLAVTPAAILGLIAAFVLAGADLAAGVLIAGAAVLIAAVSWLDDLRDLSPLIRFGTQAVAVALGLAAFPHNLPLFLPELPIWADRVFCFFAWLWFVNLFNFMDGIDGITATELGAVSVGVLAIAALSGLPGELPLFSAMLIGAALGFAVWNWHPARVFLGDVGSIPLGFLLGWVLIDLAAQGHRLAAVILPAYYLFDASFTLLRRILSGEKPWQAHRSHFYQRATQRGLTHAEVCSRIAAGNALLILAAVLSDYHSLLAVGIAGVAVGATLLSLRLGGRQV